MISIYTIMFVYCVELGFIAWLAALLDDASQLSVRHRRELREQLDRPSLSVLLNTAEGTRHPRIVLVVGRFLGGISERSRGYFLPFPILYPRELPRSLARR